MPLRILEAIETFMWPDGVDRVATKRHRRRFTIIACVTALLVWLVILPVLFGRPYVIAGVGTVAWANDTVTKADHAQAIDERKKTDETLEQAITDLAKSVNNLAEHTKQNGALLKENTIAELQRTWCQAYKKGQRLTKIAQRIDELSKEYRKATGEQPFVPNCDQV